MFLETFAKLCDSNRLVQRGASALSTLVRSLASPVKPLGNRDAIPVRGAKRPERCRSPASGGRGREAPW